MHNRRCRLMAPVSSFPPIHTDDWLVERIVSAPQAQGCRVEGLHGSLLSIIIAKVFERDPSFHLVVFEEEEKAMCCCDDLRRLLSDVALFFPYAPTGLPPHERPIQQQQVLERLTKQDAPCVVITHTSAVSQGVIKKTTAADSLYTLSVGAPFHREKFFHHLEQAHFNRKSTTTHPGDFSVRGGIIDIFAHNHEHPIRIEAFGDTVERLCAFSAETQYATQDHKRITLFSAPPHPTQSDCCTLLSYFPERSHLWAKGIDGIAQQIHHQHQKQQHGADEEKEAKARAISRAAFLEDVRPFRPIIYGASPNGQERTDAPVLRYQAEGQPSFGRDYRRMADYLFALQKKGYTCYVAAQSEAPIQRLHKLLEGAPFASLTKAISEGFINHEYQYALFTTHELFDGFYQPGGRPTARHSGSRALRGVHELQIGDYVTHVEHGIGRFIGLKHTPDQKKERLCVLFQEGAILYVNIQSLWKLAKYASKERPAVTLSKLGGKEWQRKRKKIKKRVEEEVEALVRLYAQRKNTKGHAFPCDDLLQHALEASFPHPETPDQTQATRDIKKDMEADYPMDRLVCGDVGFGKTELAIRAAFKAVSSGKQVAILAPTTLLCLQHYRVFKERMDDFGIKIDHINRLRSPREGKEIAEKVRRGAIEILIGTHRMMHKDFVFNDLGLLIVDEEQRFGVKMKEKLREKKVHVDTLTLSATPIPRTLHFSLSGIRDVSLIQTPPRHRHAVQTIRTKMSTEVLKKAIAYEHSRGGQVFFVHNRIESLVTVEAMLHRLFPHLEVAVAHSKMPREAIEEKLVGFFRKKYDIMLSTNIVENGLDIPNANTMFIHNAHLFGLSELHQLRGRVGRSEARAFCYLLCPPKEHLTAEARKRLDTIEAFSALGEGIKIALKDLEIRGAGNLLSTEQSGFISEVGFEHYHRMLDEAAEKIKSTQKYRALFAEPSQETKRLIPKCVVESGETLTIPSHYIEDEAERLSIYLALSKLPDEKALEEYLLRLRDRFGPLPPEMEHIATLLRVRYLGTACGFERIVHKEKEIKCCFPVDNEAFFDTEAFQRILSFVQRHPQRYRLAEGENRGYLIGKGITNGAQMVSDLREMMLGKHKDPLPNTTEDTINATGHM